MGFRQDQCRVGASVRACWLWFVALLPALGLLVVVRFRAVHRCCVLGCCFPLSKNPLVVKLSSLCWLAALRGAGGSFGAEGSWLLQVSRKSGCTCFTEWKRHLCGSVPRSVVLGRLQLNSIVGLASGSGQRALGLLAGV